MVLETKNILRVIPGGNTNIWLSYAQKESQTFYKGAMLRSYYD